MKIKVEFCGKEQYVSDIKNSTSDESVALVLTDETESQWSYRGLALLTKKFPSLVFVME